MKASYEELDRLRKENKLYREFAAEVYSDDCGLYVWEVDRYADITRRASQDNQRRLDKF